MASTVSFYLFLLYVPFFGSAGFPSNDLTDDNKLASKDPCCEGDGCHLTCWFQRSHRREVPAKAMNSGVV